MSRLAAGGRIDRTRPLNFTFDGQPYVGFEGDTLASALLANGVSLVGRSFKYHRPRGLVGAWMDEPNALVNLGTGARSEPNVRATTTELFGGLTARSQNAWPSLSHDALGVIDLFNGLLPAGFYYKTFMWPAWKLFEPAIREIAGAAVAPAIADDQSYAHRNAHCDVLVIGAGPAGLAAALAAGSAGARVILADDRPEAGGSIAWRGGEVDGAPAQAFVDRTLDRLRAMPHVQVLPRTQVFGAYDHGFFAMIERVTDHLNRPVGSKEPRQRLWRVRAKRAVISTGAIERPLIFPDNDRPGVMLASAACEYARRYATKIAERPIVFANNDDGCRAALDLAQAGLGVRAVVDVRDKAAEVWRKRLHEADIQLLTGCAVVGVAGRNHVRRADIVRVDGTGPQSLDCDAVLVAGGWSPSVHLHSQAGGRLEFDDDLSCFRPIGESLSLRVAGGANGQFSLAQALRDGWEAGRLAAQDTVMRGPEASEPVGGDAAEGGLAIQAFWRVPAPLAKGRRQWVDFQNDVTTKDLALAAREGFRSVEHLKRYTTTGMANDQGKTSNVNALAVLSEELSKQIPEVGTTTFRPPYTGVTLAAFAGPYRGALQRPYRYLPTHDEQVQAGAVFVDAGQWLRPDYYPRAGETKEAAATREMIGLRMGVALFEATPLGKILVSGPDAAKFLDHIYLNNASSLKVGSVRYGAMATEHGVLFDDGVFARLAPDQFLVSCSSGVVAQTTAMMEEWLQCEWIDWQVTIQGVTAQYATIAIAGPKSRDLLSRVCPDIDLAPASFPHMAFRNGTVAGLPARVMRVSFTGEIQYEVSVRANEGPALWRALMAVGQDLGVFPVGAEAWLRMRIEKGYLHVGTDTDGSTTPDDVGFSLWRRKSYDFVGRRSLLRSDANRPNRLQLIGLVGADPKTLLPVGAQVLQRPEVVLPAPSDGRVTSSCLSPALGQSIALALVRRGRDRVGEDIALLFGERRFMAKVVAPPFYDPEGELLRA